MLATALLTLILSLLGQGNAQALDPAWMLQVATPTYGTDGKVAGASAGFRGGRLALNQPLVVYAYSGRTLCESSSPVMEEPDGAGFGWRVQITPLRNDGGLVAQVEWQRLWERGQKVTTGQRGSAQVTFKPGARIVFDYLGSTRALSANMAAEAAAVTGRAGCTTVGMGLEIGLAPIERQELIEANLWLVRTLPDGSEQSQRQTIRLKPGADADYYFDDVSLAKSFFFFNQPAPSEARVRTFGRMSDVDIKNGTTKMDLKIEQYVVDNASPTGLGHGGSSTFPLSAGPNEVLSFQVPKISAEAERLSLRVQVRQLR